MVTTEGKMADTNWGKALFHCRLIFLWFRDPTTAKSSCFSFDWLFILRLYPFHPKIMRMNRDLISVISRASLRSNLLRVTELIYSQQQIECERKFHSYQSPCQIKYHRHLLPHSQSLWTKNIKCPKWSWGWLFFGIQGRQKGWALYWYWKAYFETASARNHFSQFSHALFCSDPERHTL